MRHGPQNDADKYVRAHQRKKRWYQVVTALAAVVVFCTTYALILPAITMEKDVYEAEEGTDTESDAAEKILTRKVPVCTIDSLEIHEHTPDCYDITGESICGYADFVVHEHDVSCYDEEGNLWCPLPEIEVHTHDSSCYAPQNGQAQAVHTHSQECYTLQRGELICGKTATEGHTHSADCYTQNTTLICTIPESDGHQHGAGCYTQMSELICTVPESDGHQHGAGCYNENGEQICTIPESDGHHHGESCYWVYQELTCPLAEEPGHYHGEACYETTYDLTCRLAEEPAHEHTDECYAWEEILTCNLLADPSEVVQPQPVCGKKEIILHEHTAECLDEKGNLICQKTQVLEHVHGEECFCMEEIPVDSQEQFEENREAPVLLSEEEENGTSEDIETTPTPTATPTVTPTVTPEAEETPLKVENYISSTNGVVLKYSTKDNPDNWIIVTDTTLDIPGDASFRLEIKYENVPIDKLLKVGNKMTFTLPELFRNASTIGTITSGSETVGSINVEGQTVTLELLQSWLNNQKTGENTVINGDFYVMAEANLSEIPGDGQATIKIGSVTIRINFEGDIIAQYGNVEINKEIVNSTRVEEEEDGDYLNYKLTVTAGADGCPGVKVVDNFTDKTYIAEYVGVTVTETPIGNVNDVTETGAPDGKGGSVYIGSAPTDDQPIPQPGEENLPGTLVWVIGEMAPNETRILEYKVKLKEEYTGILSKGNITNEATVFSKEYSRDSDSESFTPKAGATMSKVSSEFVPNESGGGTITYTIWVKALDDNSYTLDNVKIVDALDGTIQGINKTPDEIRKYLSYDDASFKLYQGGQNGQNGSSGLTEISDGSGPTFTDTDNDNKYNGRFTYYIGSLAPGECKTLVYSINVDPGVYVAAENDAFSINNRARIYTDDTQNDGNQSLNAYNASRSIGRKAWNRKLVGQEIEQVETITMTGADFYDATNETLVEISPPPADFTVPAGSYQYQVVANEAGDWDLSSASMRDNFDNTYMEFVGYVQVRAYEITTDAPGSDLTDETVIANLNSRVPVKTVWVNVDKNTSFAFTPAEIGLTGHYAYLLTYYAQPVNLNGVSQVLVSNSFSLSGDVGIGDKNYTLTDINVSASVTVEGENHFTAEKQSWYYEAPKVTTGDFINGALYWAIKVDGNTIPAGTQIKDVTNQTGGSAHYIRGTSFVGMYVGNPGENGISGFENVEALEQCSELSKLTGQKVTSLDTSPESCDFIYQLDNNSAVVKLLKDVVLGAGQSLYIIIKTEPSNLPAAKRDAFVYNNKLQSSSNGSDWLDHNTASQTLYGSENVFKELGRVFTYPGTGTSITDIKGGTNQAVATGHLNGAGTYVAWQIHVNYEGNLAGRYRVIEQIPEGMEVSYVRIWWVGSKITGNPPYTVDLTEEELAALDGEWSEVTKQIQSNNIGSKTNYYYTNGQQVFWDVANLIAGGGSRDDYAVEFQIVCKVTDPNVLLGGEEKVFNNIVKLQNSSGEEIGMDQDGVTIKKQTLAKEGTYNATVNGGRYPFKITLNELGEDLVSGSDTITLVDELSDTLILDTQSIQVVNTKTNEEVTDWASSVEGQTLKLVLPDNLPLTITYEAFVNAAPGQTISISNNAHWEGYSTAEGGSVEDSSFSYTAGGTVGADSSPSVKIIKLDQYNNQSHLSGAEFRLTEVTYDNANKSFEEAVTDSTFTGTTGDDGTLIFGKENGQVMKYNTIYRLTETKAPAGYVLDSTPHYFAVAKADENGVYPSFPAGVTVWYQSAQYTYQAYNHKGEATVKKAFRDAGGNSLNKLNGTYRFGIYEQAISSEEETSSGNPLQTVSITYDDTTVTPQNGEAKFTNLILGSTYYIYELDDKNQPILDNAKAVVNGKDFIVTYSDGPEVTVPGDGAAAGVVTVTNRVCYPELPLTGGPGTKMYTIGGLLMMFSAGFLLMYNSKRRKEDTISS